MLHDITLLLLLIFLLILSLVDYATRLDYNERTGFCWELYPPLIMRLIINVNQLNRDNLNVHSS